MNRVFLTKLHLIAAALMLPAILMFLFTGALYTWGKTGAWHEDTVAVELSAPLTGDEGQFREIAGRLLSERDLPMPSGKSKLTGEGAEASFQWSGARSEIALAPTADPLVAEATIKEASLHRWLVQLHKAKGSVFFKVYASILALVLFVLSVSGVILGLQVRPYRRLTILGSAVGVIAFVAAVLLG